MNIPCPTCNHTLVYDKLTFKCKNHKCIKYNKIQIGKAEEE